MSTTKAKRDSKAIDAGHYIVVNTAEVNAVLAGRRLDAAILMLKGLTLDLEGPCSR